MKIQKTELAYFVQYLLELYVSTSINKFIGEKNKLKRANLVLGAIKLGCHFMCSKLWKDRVLKDFNFGLEEAEKYSKILFGLFMNNGNNSMVHEKYRMSRYRGVSNIKIVSSGQNKMEKGYQSQNVRNGKEEQSSSGS